LRLSTCRFLSLPIGTEEETALDYVHQNEHICGTGTMFLTKRAKHVHIATLTLRGATVQGSNRDEADNETNLSNAAVEGDD
jgi:hypothetical protein